MVVIRNHGAGHPDALSIIEKIVRDVRTAVQAIPIESLDFGLCHGDFHSGNLHLHEDRVTHFDFEECAFGFRIYDIATFKSSCGTTERLAKQWPAFLEGYESIRPLSKPEASLIDTFVILREFAETAYGIRYIKNFGHNDIIAADIDDWCARLSKLNNP